MYLKRICIAMLCILCSMLATGCAGMTSTQDASIVHFGFSESGYPSFCEISIDKNEKGKYHFSSTAFDPYNDELVMFDGKDGFIKKKDIDKLEEIINAYDINSWDGFHESDLDILDGSAFTLNITYSDGKEVNADGYMVWPEGYDEARDSLMEHLQRIAEKM